MYSYLENRDLIIFLYILAYKCLFTLWVEMGYIVSNLVHWQFSENFWAVATGIFLYARDFVAGSNSQEFSGQWRRGFSLYARDFVAGSNSKEFSGQWRRGFYYMPGILSLALILRKFPGTGGENFSICPGFCRWF